MNRFNTVNGSHGDRCSLVNVAVPATTSAEQPAEQQRDGARTVPDEEADADPDHGHDGVGEADARDRAPVRGRVERGVGARRDEQGDGPGPNAATSPSTLDTTATTAVLASSTIVRRGTATKVVRRVP